MGVFGLNIGIFPGHFVERPLPQVEGICQHIGLAAQRQLLCLVAFAAVFEGEPYAALHTLARIDGFLSRDLVCRASLQEPARACIKAFGVFPDDNEIYILRFLVFQGRIDAGIELNGPQIYVLIQAEAELKEDALFEYARFYIGMADGAEIYCIESSSVLQWFHRSISHLYAYIARRPNHNGTGSV